MKKLVMLLVTMFLFLALASATEYIVIEKRSNEKAMSRLSIQNDVIDEMGLDVTHNYKSFNGFAAELSEEEYERLVLDSRFDVYEERKYHTMLDSSNSQVNASDSWNLQHNSINMTGTSQTVCVLDTGVNYSHPALGGCYGNNDPSSSCTVIGGYDFINIDSDPMDDNSHGTHVAGIVASNDSTYQGVAPGVKIIAMKIMDSGGNGGSGDLIDAIEWCTDNASKFNITVISMSLGDSTLHYDTHCDSYDAGTSAAIQGAVQNNITVVVSTGNNATDPDGISWPSCTSGVIPVGSVRDDDSIYYQRGDLFQVLAPGGGVTPNDYITSTNYANDGFTTKRGTSMAAPHVSGLVAILNQFYNLQNSANMTNASVVDAVNQSDVIVNDSGVSGNLFARVNFLTALYSIDSTNPLVTLVSPLNNTLNYTGNYTFVFNTTDFALRNITFYLYNSTSLVNSTSYNLTGSSDEKTLTVEDLQTGVYYWTAEAFDMNNNSFRAQNNSLTVGFTTSVVSPANNSYTNSNETNFSCLSRTSNGTNLTNMTFSIFNSSLSLIYNETNNFTGEENTSTFNYTIPSDGVYLWNCLAFNNESANSSTENITITLDRIVPNNTVVAPLPTSVTSDSVSKTFYYNASDNYDDLSCSLIYSSAVQSTATVTNYSETQSVTKTMTPGAYAWKVNCTDLAGNSNLTAEYAFTITAETSSSSGSSSGGGGGGSDTKGTKAKPYTSQDFKDGFRKVYLGGSIAYFENAEGELHSVRVINIIEGIVNITLSSDPINFALTANTSRKFNLSSPEILDTLVEVSTVTQNTALIRVIEINETNPEYQVPVQEEEKTFSTTEEEGETGLEAVLEEKPFPIIQTVFMGVSVMSLLGLVFIGLLLFHHRKRKKSLEVAVDNSKESGGQNGKERKKSKKG